MIDDCDASLIAFMESGVSSAQRWDLLTIELSTGQVLRYTDREAPIKLPDGRTFAVGPLLERSRLSLVSGLEVDSLTAKLLPRATDTLSGVKLMTLARLGVFRGCQVLLEWAYYDASGTAYKGRMGRFRGTGSPSSLEGGVIELTVKSECERLKQQMPRDLYQPSCLNTVYDPLCQASRSAKLVSGAVNSVYGDPPRARFSAPLVQAAGWFDRGAVTFLTGANAGHSRTVRSFDTGVFTFALPFPFDIVPGDTFEAVPGCDGSISHCVTRFNNLVHFRGQSFIPAPEVVT